MVRRGVQLVEDWNDSGILFEGVFDHEYHSTLLLPQGRQSSDEVERVCVKRVFRNMIKPKFWGRPRQPEPPQPVSRGRCDGSEKLGTNGINREGT